MTGAVRHPGLILGVGRFFHDPRGSMRGVLESAPSEGRLFLYALVASVIWIGRNIPALHAGAGSEDVLGLVVAQAFSVGFLVLFFYLLAVVGTVLARLFHGRGSWAEGRAAFFWAALVSAPMMALSGLAPLAFAEAPDAVLVALAEAGPVFFAWALAQCYAEAFGFRRGWPVFAVIAALVLAIVAALWAVRP